MPLSFDMCAGTEEADARSLPDSAGGSQWPDLSIPIAMTSYLFLSIASATFLAERREISCSADLPPKRRATRIFRFIIGTVRYSRYLGKSGRMTVWPEKGRWRCSTWMGLYSAPAFSYRSL